MCHIVHSSWMCWLTALQQSQQITWTHLFIWKSIQNLATNTVNSLLTATSLKQTPLYSGHVQLVPAVLQSFTSSPSKADTSLRRTVGAGLEHVRLRGGSWLYFTNWWFCCCCCSVSSLPNKLIPAVDTNFLGGAKPVILSTAFIF